MSSLGSPSTLFLAKKGAYEIDRSLRFNDNDSPILTRTFSSAGNRKTWTLSCWLKRSNIDTYQGLLAVGTVDGSEDFLGIDTSNRLNYRFNVGSDLKTLALLRDVNEWYHIVVVLDTTQSQSSASASDSRLRFYINGVRQTEWDESEMPSQNFETRINNNVLHYIGEYPRISSHLDGYLAEVNFVDGLALDASYFAETNAITGQWNPKKYTGSYGTNGFYLNFSTDTLGTDRSGNGNDFTPNGFSVAAGAGNDALSDTPTNNFATMNSLVPSPTVTWSNGNLDLTGSSSSQYSQNNTSTFGVSSGKWYAEVKYTYSGTTNAYVGICPITAAADANMTGSITDAAVLRMNNETYIEGTSASSGTSIDTSSSGYIIGIALDMDNQKVWFSVQGTYINSGNPSTGANATFDGITAGETIAICARPLNNTLNFNFGQRDFEYTPPTGFKTLCSANLPDPTILLPNKHFDTLLYTGNGSTNNITGLNFSPDWVWGKERSPAADRHWLADSVRGKKNTGYYLLCSNNTDSDTNDAPPDGITAINSDGFTLGANSSNTDGGWSIELNQSSGSYVAWNWNGGDTDGKTYTVTVVDDSGNKYRFDGFAANAVTLDLVEGGTYIFNYPSAHPFRFSTTADGTHGGGSEYTTGVTVISSTSIQIVVAASAPTLYYYCSSHSGMGGAINTNSTLGSSNFDGTIQSVNKVNALAGFSIIKYTGNGTTGSTIGHGLGVKPDAIIIKRRNSSSDWMVYHKEVNDGVSPEDYYLSLNNTNAQTNNIIMLNDTAPTSSVVTLYANSAVNSSSDTYVMYCFSEVAGYSKFGRFTGNGSTDGAFAFCGFRPAWVFIRSTSSGRHWVMNDSARNPHNVANKTFLANASNAEDSGSSFQIDILSNGFKCRTDGVHVNTNGGTHIFFAFAESPFKNARAR